MGELTALPNIAQKMEKQLNDVGVYTTEQLKELGSKEVWLRIKAMDPSACYNRLCGLQGAIMGVRWHYLPDEVKAELKEFYNANK